MPAPPSPVAENPGRATAPDRFTAATRAVALAAALALVALDLGWELAWAPTGHGRLALKALPFVLALPGLAAYRLVTCRWLALLTWLYVAEGAVRLRDAWPVPPLAAAQLVLALVLFATCAAQVRHRIAVGRRLRLDEAPTA